MNQFYPMPYAPQFSQNIYARPSDLQFVNGIESAQAYQMAPNSKQILMDANKARFYLVATDAAGMKSVKAYDFTEVNDKPQVEYVTREEFEKLKECIKNESNSRRKRNDERSKNDERLS